VNFREKHVKALFPVFLYFLVFAAFMSGFPKITLAGGAAVAKVNGVLLTEEDLDEAMNEIVPAAAFHGAITDEKKIKYRPEAIQLLVDKELLYQEALALGMKVSKDRIRKAKEDRVKSMGGEGVFKRALKQRGITEREYENKLERNFLIKDIKNAEMEDKAKISDEEVKAYYERNKKGYIRPDAFRLRHILISVKPNATEEQRAQRLKRAEEALAKANAGQDIGELAWNYSDDPYRVKGGDLGLVHKGRLDPDLEKEVLKLQKGQLSGIIETIYGYHIVKVEDRVPGGQMSLSDVSDKIRSELKVKKLEELKDTYLARLREKAKIEIY
jgi:peptidyl-prolyl cis-trans isomerase C